MDEVLTVPEIEQRYREEWILLDDPEIAEWRGLIQIHPANCETIMGSQRSGKIRGVADEHESNI